MSSSPGNLEVAVPFVQTFQWSGLDGCRSGVGTSSTHLLCIGCEPLKDEVQLRKTKILSGYLEEAGWSPCNEFKLPPASVWLQDSSGDKRTVCQLTEHSSGVDMMVRKPF